MKKVCILTSVHPPFDNRIFYKQARTLIEAGHDVTLIAQHDKNETIDGIKIIALPKPKNRFFRIFKTTRTLYKIALAKKADIYHFHDPELLPWAIKLKKKTGAKIIYDVHEDIPKQILSKKWIPKIIRKPISALFNMFEKHISKKIDCIITVTPEIKNNFKKHKKVEVIANYPVIKSFTKLKSENRHMQKNEPVKLIYAGGLTKIRGIKEIIESLKFINTKYDIKLKILGKFSDKEFEEEIKNMDEWGKVNFLGWQRMKIVVEHLLKADIGLICLWPEPNHITSCPNKIYEYMISGLPVIASNYPSMEGLINNNKCGVCVDPMDPKEIAKAVEYFIEHPDEARKMGENGRKAVLNKYNWENDSKKLLQIYEEL